MNKKVILLLILILIIGVLIGGFLFKDVKSRSFLSINDCKDCLNSSQILGLLGSIGVQKLPDFIPFVVKETDKTIVMDSPVHKASIHYVIIPKKDIKDIGDISQEDKEYLIDAYAVIGDIIRKENLTKYKIYTNGPSYQTVNYLHFHLMSEDTKE